MLNKMLSVSAAICTGLLLAACSGHSHSANEKSASASSVPLASNEFAKNLPDNARALRVATDEAYYAPFAFRDEYGQIIGFDVDMITAIAADQNMKVEIYGHAWDGIFNTLDNSSRDLIMGGMNVTPERKEKYILSEAYTQLPAAIVVKANSPIQSVSDLNGKKVASLAGSNTEETLKEKAVNSAQVIPSNTLYLALKELLMDNVDAVVGDELILAYHANNLKDHPTRIITMPSENDDVVFAVRKDNRDLANKIDQGLANIKRNGIYDKINAKWFGDSHK